MKIGIDIDNTIINYSDAFLFEAKKIAGLENILGRTKSKIKSEVINVVGEVGWTEMQGRVYAKAPRGLKVFENFESFLIKVVNHHGYQIFYISHKTRHPILGPKVDLREPILDFMSKQQLLDPPVKGVAIQFHDTQEEKIEAIRSLRLDFFIDDLVEIVDLLQFDCTPIHFMCTCNNLKNPEHLGFKDWSSIDQFFNIKI